MKNGGQFSLLDVIPFQTEEEVFQAYSEATQEENLNLWEEENGEVWQDDNNEQWEEN